MALPHDELTWVVRIIITVLFFCLLVDEFKDEVKDQKSKNIQFSHDSPPFSDSFPVGGRGKIEKKEKRQNRSRIPSEPERRVHFLLSFRIDSVQSS